MQFVLLDIVVTESNVYITYKGCINRNGNSIDYRSYIVMYDKDGTFVKKQKFIRELVADYLLLEFLMISYM